MSTPQIETPAPARRPFVPVRCVVFDNGGSVEATREVAKLVKAGVVEDARPVLAKPAACSHPECKAKFLIEFGWVKPSDLAKVAGDPTKAKLRCIKHRADNDRKVSVAIVAWKQEAKEQAEAQARKAAADKREEAARARRGEEDLQNLLRRTRR